MLAKYVYNIYNEKIYIVIFEMKDKVKVLILEECLGLVYFLLMLKFLYGVDVDFSGEYIVGNGKLFVDMVVYFFIKIQEVIVNEFFEIIIDGIFVLKYDEILVGIVEKFGLGLLYIEFDGKGNVYIIYFIFFEIVKWDIEIQQVLDCILIYYFVGYLMIFGGDFCKLDGKYMVVFNKIMKDCYLFIGLELNYLVQLYDILGDKMKLLFDFLIIGELYYVQVIVVDKVMLNFKKFYFIEENEYFYCMVCEKDVRVEWEGKDVYIYMISIWSYFVFDNIEGIKVGDCVYFYLINFEQDWDVLYGFVVLGV